MQSATNKVFEYVAKRVNASELRVAVFPDTDAKILQITRAEFREALDELEAAKRISCGKPTLLDDGRLAIPLALVLTSKERAKRYRQKQLDAGRKQFAFWLTPEENELLKKTLAEYRAGNRPLSFE